MYACIWTQNLREVPGHFAVRAFAVALITLVLVVSSALQPGETALAQTAEVVTVHDVSPELPHGVDVIPVAGTPAT